MKRELKLYGEPVLRTVAEPVSVFDAELRALAADMLETMREAKGIGLAAPQVGVSRQIFVMDVPKDLDVDEEDRPRNPDVAQPLVLVNPRILEQSGPETVYEEGCLSIPGVTGNVKRRDLLRLAFQDVNGRGQELQCCGLLARCALHEYDHLQGVLFIDHLSHVKRMAIAGKLRRLKDGE